MTWKFQSGQEKHAKNRNCVYLLSAPPRLKHTVWLQAWGRLMVTWRTFFFPLLHSFNFWILFPFFGNLDETWVNEFDHISFWFLIMPLSIYTFNLIFVPWKENLILWAFTDTNTFSICQFIILIFPVFFISLKNMAIYL